METNEYEMPAEDVKKRLENDESMTLIDVRSEREREIASLEDDYWIPLEEIPGEIGRLRDCEPPVVVYCHHGVRSLQVARELSGKGMEEVYSLAGGIDYWSLTINPELDRY